MSTFYYDDPDRWGEYQYVTLDQLVTDYIMSRSQDDTTALEPRHKLLYHFRRAVQEFNYDVLQEIKVASLDLSPDTLTVTLPPDYVNYVRVSYVDERGMLQAIDRNDKLNIAYEYLQDNDYQILYDDGGCPLQDDEGYLSKIKRNSDKPLTMRDCDHIYYFANDKFKPNLNMSNVFVNGYFKLDRRRGVMIFSDQLKAKQIVIEYISDGLAKGCAGLPEEKLGVHKFAERAVNEFVYYQLIKNRRNVAQSEKARARKEYEVSKRNARRRLNTLRRNELIQSFKSSSKWMKN